VARVGREADRETREFVVDVRVGKLPPNWATGQRAEVFIETARTSGVVVLPQRFVLWRGGRPGAFVLEGGRARWRTLTLGLRGRDGVEVRQGCQRGRPRGGAARPRRPPGGGAAGARVVNLATQDIRHNLGRFLLTGVGIGLLLMIVLGMSGIYRGMIDDAMIVVDRVGADLWVVQRGTRGPFAEISRVPALLEHRLLAVPGVASARSFVSHNVQREHGGRPLRMNVQGLAWPEDKGEWLTLAAGRPLGQARYEMVADQSLGLALGERLPLGKDTYTVVGLTKGMVSSGGDGLAFFTVRDAQAIQFDLSGEAIRAGANGAGAPRGGPGRRSRPAAAAGAGGGPAAGIPALGPPLVSAITVRLAAGADPQAVAAAIAAWPDVSVHTRADQRDLLLYGMIDKARRQIGLFRVLLVIISTIIMALILYTLTLDKIHDIALLKLMGARNSMIVGLILQQALLLGLIGYGIAYCSGSRSFPRFPRRVLIAPEDLWGLALVVVAISVAWPACSASGRRCGWSPTRSCHDGRSRPPPARDRGRSA
jgi:putative ABC transport system permease protein